MSKDDEVAAEHWRRVIESQRASGQTVAGYCRSQGISQASYYGWKRRLGLAGFVEIKAVEGQARSGEGIEVLLRGEHRLRVGAGFDRQLLIDLVRTLEEIK